jgi:YD repeat-containing protein
MVAVVNGSGLGLFTSRGSSGSAGLGQSHDQVFVNSTTGNLVIQGVDEILTATGADIAITRTYNSLGLADGDNNDGWRIGVLRSLVITTGVSIVKTFGDGARVTYNWNGTAYVSTEGDGAHDKISASGSNWIWTDGSGRDTETYDSTGKILNTKDASGNTVTFAYGTGAQANVIVQVTTVSPSAGNGGDASTTNVYLDYTAGTLNLGKVRVVRNGVTETLTSYTYDNQNRLSTVTVDLSPSDNSTANNDALITTYAYQGATNLVASITQKKGGSANVTATVSFTYQLIDGDYRLKTYTDGESHTTTLTYGTPVTTGASNATPSANSGVLSTTDTQNVTNNYNLNTSAVSTTDTTTNTYNVSSSAIISNGTQTDSYNRNDAVLTTTDTATNTYNVNSAALTTNATQTDTYNRNNAVLSTTDTQVVNNSNGLNMSAVSTTDTQVVTNNYNVDNAQLSTNIPITSNYNLNGSALTTPVVGWVSPQTLASSVSSGTVLTKYDAQGNGFALWVNGLNLMVARYVGSTGAWDAATALYTNAITGIRDVSLGIDDAGNAIAAWGYASAAVTTNGLIMSRIYTASSATWAAVQTLATINNSGQVAAAIHGGVAAVAWTAPSTTDNPVNTWARVFSGGAWSTATRIGINVDGISGAFNAANPVVDVDSAGGVMVAWIQGTNAFNIYTSRYSAGSWSTTTVLRSNTPSNALRGAFFSNGDGFLFGFGTEIGRYNRAANTWSWTALAATLPDWGTANVALSADGTAVASWRVTNGTVYGSYFNGSSWSTTTLATANGWTTSIGMNNGHAVVTYNILNGSTYERYSRTLLSGAWSGATLLGTSTSQRTDSGSAGVDAAGNLHVLWIVNPYGTGTSLRDDEYLIPTSFTPYYQIPAGATWQSIANALYAVNSAEAGSALQSAMGNPSLTAGTKLTGWPSSLSVTVSTYIGPFYTIQSGDTWQSIANNLYHVNSADAGNALQNAMGNPALIAGNRLMNPPTTLTVVSIVTVTVPAYYTIPLGATWQSVALALYGTNAIEAANALQSALGGIALPATGSRLTGLPNPLSYNTTQIITVAPYYTISSGASWQSVANTIYGVNSAAAGAALQAALGGIALPAAGNRLTGLPTTLSVTTTLAPHYLVPASASWQWIANALYGVNNTQAGTALQTALGNPSIAQDQRLYNIPSTLTVTAPVPAYYLVPSGASWQSIANTVYGINSVAAGNALQAAMGNPTLSTNLHLMGLPGTLSITTTFAPHYLVPAGASWQSIAYALYGVNSTAAGSALQAVLGNPSIAQGQRLYNIPATLTVSTTGTVSAYYVIPSSPTWQGIANTLYGVNSVAAGSALQAALGNLTLVAGNRLTNLPSILAVTTPQVVTVPAYYIVPAGATWTSITQAVYGTTHPNAVAALRTATGNPTLTTNYHLTVPLSLTYLVTAASTIYRSTDIVDALGLTVTWQTDTLGRLSSTFTPTIGGARIETRYGYDGEGNISTITQDPAGLNRVTTMTYSNGNLLSTRDAFGNTVTRTYSATNQVLTETHYLVPDTGSGASGALVTHYIYDSADRLRFVITPEGRVTESRYQSVTGVRQTMMVYTAAAYTGSTWTAAALTTFATTNQGAAERTDFFYDFRGNLSETRRYVAVNSSGVGTGTPSSTLYTYDARGFLKNIIEARGAATTGDLTDYVTSFTYDGLGRQLTRTEWIDATHTRTTTSVWSDQNRQFSITLTQTGAATGLVTTTTYDRAGVVTSVVNTSTASTALGTTSFLYDSDNRLRVSVDPNLNKTYYVYDELSRKVGEVDALGRLTQLVYDSVSEPTKTIHYSSFLSSTMMATLGHASSVVNIADLLTDLAAVPGRDATKDQITRSTFDAAGRMTYTVDPNGGVTQFFYDGAGRVTGTKRYATPIGAGAAPSTVVADPVNDRRTRNFYDNDGNLLATLDAQGFVVENEYDKAGHLVHQVAYANATSSSSPYTDAYNLVKPVADVETVADYETDIHSYFYYDGQGRQVAVLDGLAILDGVPLASAKGYLTELTYDLAGNVVQSTRYQNPAVYNASLSTVRTQATGSNLSTSSSYDGVGRVASTSNEEGTATSFTYNALDLVTSTTQTDRTTQTRYDELGRVKQTMGGEGSAQTTNASQPTLEDIWTRWGVAYTLDNAGRCIKSTDQYGNKQYFYYDADNRLRFTAVDLGDGTAEVRETQYNELGQVSHSFAYSGRINSSVLTGGVITAAFSNELNSRKDGANDAHESFTYKPAGQLQSVTSAEGALTTNSYNGFGELSGSVQKINASQNYGTTYEYDKRGLITKTIEDVSGINHTMTYTYDAFGRRTTAKDQSNNLQKWEYDQLGRAVATYSPVNAKRVTNYDAFNRVKSTVDAYGNTTNYAYNVAAKSTTMTTQEGVVVTTTHTEHGQTYAITVTGGGTTAYQYDKDGNVTSISDSLGTVATRTYDRADRLDTSVDARGIVTKYGYDAASRTLTRTEDYNGLALVTTYAYDALGRVKRVTEPGNLVTDTTYYRDGRVKMVTVDPAGANLRTLYEYDAAGNTLKVTEHYGSSKPLTTQYIYDNLNRRTEEIVDGTGLNLRTQYQYDANGNLTRKIEGSQLAAGQRRNTWYFYDAAGRNTQIVDALGGVTEQTYDLEDRIVAVRRYATAATVSAAGELTGTVPPGTSALDRVERTAYDRDGRAVYTINALGGITQRTFDASGNVTRTRLLFNELSIGGNPTAAAVSTAITNAGYDANTPGPNDRVSWSAYDLRNRIVYSVDTLGGVTKYVYDVTNNAVEARQYASPYAGSIKDKSTLDAWLTTTVSGQSYSVDNDPNNRVTRSWYDSLGRVRYVQNAQGYVTETSYNDAARTSTEKTYYSGPYNVSLATPTASVGSQLTSTPADDRYTTTEMDTAGRLSKVTDSYGNYEQYGYDDAGNRQTFRNKNGSTWTYQYDVLGRLTAEITPLVDTYTASDGANITLSAVANTAITTRIQYTSFGDVWKRTEAAGVAGVERTTEYAYDLLGRQTRTIYPAVGYYNGDANDVNRVGTAVVRADAAPEQLYTEVTYDALGDAVVNRDLAGNYNFRVYDQLGRARFEIDAERGVTEHAFDRFGNEILLTRYSSLYGGSMAGAPISYLGFSPPATSTLDRAITKVYDRLNRKTSEYLSSVYWYSMDTAAYAIAPATPTTNYYYNAFGEVYRQAVLLTVNGAGSGAYANTYFYRDKLGRVIAEVDPLNFLTATEYDAAGNVRRTVEYAAALASPTNYATPTPTTPANAAGSAIGYDRETRFTYDRLNRVKTQVAVNLEYSTISGQTAGRANALTVTNTFDYDAVGNRTKVTDELGASVYTYYDALGRTSAVVDAARDISTGGTSVATRMPLTVFKRDALGNVVRQIAYASGISTLPGAGALPTPLAVDGTADQSITTTFDSLGRALHTEDSIGADKYVSYTKRGDVAKEWQIVSNYWNFATRYEALVTIHGYDKLGRETLVLAPQALPNGADITVAVIMQSDQVYNTFGELVSRKTYDKATTAPTGEGAYETFDYDNAGRLWRTNAGDGVYKVYLYDLAGRKTVDLVSRANVLAPSVSTTAAQAASQFTQVMRTETRFNAGGQAIEQRLPSFTTLSDLRESIAASVAVGVVYTIVGDPNAGYTYTTTGTGAPGNPVLHVLTWSPTTSYASGGGYRRDLTRDTSHAIQSGRYINWSDPPTTVADATQIFEYRIADQGNAWSTRSIEKILPNGTRSLGAYVGDLANGIYEYRIRYVRAGETLEFATITGRITNPASATTLTDTTASTLGATATITPTTTQTYDRWGNVLSATDALNNTTNYRYDQRSQLIERLLPTVSITAVDSVSGAITTSTGRPKEENFYDKFGRVIGTRDGNGVVSSVTLDPAGEITREDHADGGFKTYAYDILGNRVREADERGYLTTHRFNQQNLETRLQRESDVGAIDGNVSAKIVMTDFAYDEAGRKISDNLGQIMRYYYDLRGNLRMRRTPAGYETRFEYDTRGNKTKETDALGGVKDWTYDYFGHTLTHHELGAITVGGGGATQAATYGYAAGILHHYNYDKAGLLTDEDSDAGKHATYTYDTAGHVTKIVEDGTATTASGLSTVMRTTDYVYDALGRHVREKSTVEGQVHENLNIRYDAAGRLSATWDISSDISYAYDAASNRTRMTARSNSDSQGGHVYIGNAGGGSDTYDYVSNGWYGGTMALDVAVTDYWFKYDKMGHVTISRGANQSGVVGRITNDSNSQSFTYDLAGNRKITTAYGKVTTGPSTSINGTSIVEDFFDGLNRIVRTTDDAYEVALYSYDYASRQEYATTKWYETGNLITQEIRSFYDGENRLTKQETRKKTGSGASILQSRVSFDNTGQSLQWYTTGSAPYPVTYTPYFGYSRGYDQSGALRGYLVEDFDANGNSQYYTSYSIQYRLGDTYLESGQSLNGTYPHQVADYSHSYYDLNNNLTNFVDDNFTSQNKIMAYDAEGQLLTLVNGSYGSLSTRSTAFAQALSATAQTGVLGWRRNYFAGGNALGSIAGYVNQVSLSDFKWSFNIDDSAVKPEETQQPGQVAVRPNDTLRSIAQRIYGDGNLWYLIGDANALYEPDKALTEGLVLRVPNNVVRVDNSAEVFKPFNVGEAIGSTAPNVLIKSPAVQSTHRGHCANFLHFVALVVALIVTAYLIDLIPESAGPLLSAWYGFLAGAAGSVAGQGIEIIAGNQSKFDWNAVAMAAVSTGIAVGVARAFTPVPVEGAPPPPPASAGAQMAKQFAVGAIANAATQGAFMALGWQDSFSWREVAIAGVSSITAAKVGDLAAKGLKGFDATVAHALGGGIGSTATRLALGGKVDFASVAADVFAQVIGDSLVARMAAHSENEQKKIDRFIESYNSRHDTSELFPSMEEILGADFSSIGRTSFSDNLAVDPRTEVSVNVIQRENFDDVSRPVTWGGHAEGIVPQHLALEENPEGTRYFFADGYVQTQSGGKSYFVSQPLSPQTELLPGAFGYLERRMSYLASSGVRSPEQLSIGGFLGDVGVAIASGDELTMEAVQSSEAKQASDHPGDSKAFRHALYLHNMLHPEAQLFDPNQVLFDFAKLGPGSGISAAAGGISYNFLKGLGAPKILAGVGSGLIADAPLQSMDNAAWWASGGVYGQSGVDFIELGISAGLGAAAPKILSVLGRWKNAVADAWSEWRGSSRVVSVADGAAADAGRATVQLEVRTAEQANDAMAATRQRPGWGGETVVTEQVPTGTRYNMVLTEGQAQALMAGEPAFGAWATPDVVPSQMFARNELAILAEFKPNVSYVAVVETTAPQTLNRGIVGSQFPFEGGGNQVEFLGRRNLRLVGQPQLLPVTH